MKERSIDDVLKEIAQHYSKSEGKRRELIETHVRKLGESICFNGEEAKGIREHAGLTRRELGDIVYLTAQSIGNYERGATNPTSRKAKYYLVWLQGKGYAPFEEVTPEEQQNDQHPRRALSEIT